MKTREYKIKTTQGDAYVMGRVAGPFGVHKDIKQKPAPYCLTHIPSGYMLLWFYQARPAWVVQTRLKDSAYPEDPVKYPTRMREVVAKIVRVVEEELGKEITQTRLCVREA